MRSPRLRREAGGAVIPPAKDVFFLWKSSKRVPEAEIQQPPECGALGVAA